MHVKVTTGVPEGPEYEGTLPITDMIMPIEFHLVPRFFFGELNLQEDFEELRVVIEQGRKWDGRSAPTGWGGNAGYADFEGEIVRFTSVPFRRENGEVVMPLAAFEKLLALWERGQLTKETVEADIPELDAMKWIALPAAGE